MKQKKIFLESEGDAWFSRNQHAVAGRKLPEEDVVLREIIDIFSVAAESQTRVLEIGCGDGSRLAWLESNLKFECHGIDPSPLAVEAARSKGIRAHVGTADLLPFESQSFDLVIFGFCLYLCDRDDLFRIASEADRVLRSPGWLMIVDFYSPVPKAKTYHHRTGVNSYKMNYSTLFTWHPAYQNMTHKVRHHVDANYSDEPDEWVAISVLRKLQDEAD